MKVMNYATLITSLQIISLITMIGTADALFSKIPSTLIFILSFAIFARCSIFISKNEKWLTRIEERSEN